MGPLSQVGRHSLRSELMCQGLGVMATLSPSQLLALCALTPLSVLKDAGPAEVELWRSSPMCWVLGSMAVHGVRLMSHLMPGLPW